MLARYAQRLVFVPTALLVPLVCILVFTGAYAWRFMAFDILLMVVFGVLGWIMKVHRYPIPAFLLAVILGPLLEANFLRATRIGGMEQFIASPINMVLAAAIVLSLVAPFIVGLRARLAK